MSDNLKPNTSELLLLSDYDKVIVAFSGGKDSLACVLHILELGVPKERMELWHHLIDGAPGSAGFMDWPVTEAYCRAVAKVFGLTIRFSWKEGGFERELLRESALTAPTSWEASDGTVRSTGGSRGKLATRRLFPQVSADLSVRWCSAYLKIDVGRKIFTNDSAFASGKFLFVTGERRQESIARAKYAEVERHTSTNLIRRVDQWRAIINWDERQCWEIIKRWRIEPHPAYKLGWGRVSCRTCIFGNQNQWATVQEIAPGAFEKVAQYEKEFGKTIQRDRSVRKMATVGVSYVNNNNDLVKLANGMDYPVSLVCTPKGQEWLLPTGAFKRDGGPS